MIVLDFDKHIRGLSACCVYFLVWQWKRKGVGVGLMCVYVGTVQGVHACVGKFSKCTCKKFDI